MMWQIYSMWLNVLPNVFSGHTEDESLERWSLVEFSPSSVGHSTVACSGICMHEHTKRSDTSWGIHTVTRTPPLWKRSHWPRALSVFWAAVVDPAESLVCFTPSNLNGTVCTKNIFEWYCDLTFIWPCHVSDWGSGSFSFYCYVKQAAC